MLVQKISVDFSEQDKDVVIEKIKEVEALIPGLINITPRDKRKISKMGDKSISFVEIAYNYAYRNKEMIPTYMDIEEFRKDYESAMRFRRIIETVKPFLEKLVDTYSLLGADAYNSALNFYSYSKTASKIGFPGSDSMVLEMSRRFDKMGKKVVTPTETVVENK